LTSFGSDTAKRDWAIVILGVISAFLFFWFYGSQHPLHPADASLGREQAVSNSESILRELSYSSTEVKYRPEFQSRATLLDSIRTQTDFEELYQDDDFKSKFPVFFWNVGVRMLQTHSDSTENSQAITLNVHLNESGNWLGITNNSLALPQRIFYPEALSSSGAVQPERLNGINADSVATNRIRFQLSDSERGVGGRNPNMIVLQNDDAEKLALYFIGKTAWDPQLMDLREVRRVRVQNFDAAEVVFRIADERIRQTKDLILTILPTGALISMQIEINHPEGGSSLLEELPPIVAGMMVLVIFAWLLILFFIRLRLRLIDIKPSLLFAVLGGMIIPVFVLVGWLYERSFSVNELGLPDVLGLVVQMGVLAAISSFAFFMVSALADSITRQYMSEKIRTLDLIRIGHIFNRPIGLGIVRGMSFAFIIAACFVFLVMFIPGLQINTQTQILSWPGFLTPFTDAATYFLISFVFTHLAFMIVMGQIRAYTENRAIILLVITALSSFLWAGFSNYAPPEYKLLLNAAFGLVFASIYLRWDFITVFVAHFVLYYTLQTAPAWLVSGSPDMGSFYFYLLTLFVLAALGYIGIYKGKSIKELPSYVPEYIEELAQEERIKQELQIARKVQQSFLPIKMPEIYGVDVAAVCKPAYETGGDYYDFLPIDENRTAIIIGDVSGKGIQAAFYMTFIKGVFHAFCSEYDSPDEVLNRTNKIFMQNAVKGNFITIVYGILDCEKGTFTFSRAGHNPVMHYKKSDNKVHMLQPSGVGIGMTDNTTFSKYLKSDTISFGRGDVIMLFTDGIVEALSKKRTYYGDDRLINLLQGSSDLTADEILNNILSDVEEFCMGERQHDDMTLVVLKMP
jgi:hypothetical protein